MSRHKIEYFSCGKKGHYKGATICKKNKPSKSMHRVKSDTDNQSSSSSEEEQSSSDHYQSKESDSSTKRSLRLSAKHVTKVRRMRVNRSVRHAGKKKKFEVDIVIKETPVKAFADTGADICIMSKKKAKEIGLKLMKTRCP